MSLIFFWSEPCKIIKKTSVFLYVDGVFIYKTISIYFVFFRNGSCVKYEERFKIRKRLECGISKVVFLLTTFFVSSYFLFESKNDIRRGKWDTPAKD